MAQFEGLKALAMRQPEGRSVTIEDIQAAIVQLELNMLQSFPQPYPQIYRTPTQADRWFRRHRPGQAPRYPRRRA